MLVIDDEEFVGIETREERKITEIEEYDNFDADAMDRGKVDIAELLASCSTPYETGSS